MTMREFNEMMKVYNMVEFISSVEGMLILTLIFGTALYIASNIRVKISNRIWFFKTKVRLALSHMVYEEPEILKNVIQFAETQINGTATVVLRDKHNKLNTFYVVVTTTLDNTPAVVYYNESYQMLCTHTKRYTSFETKERYFQWRAFKNLLVKNASEMEYLVTNKEGLA